ncbi:MAG: MFS transporter [Sphingomonas sp.]
MLHAAAEPLGRPAAVADQGVASRPHRYYVLLILTLVSSVSILDRQIMTMLVEPIRKELALSDTQIGLLTGVAFAIVYVIFCIPIARLADRWSRRKMIALAVTAWSIMTMLCGAAQNAVHLFIARFGVGLGESGGSPSTFAFVGDVFPRHQRATAMSVLSLSSPIGLSVGLAFGGWALAHYGWRAAFVLAGVPGVILGLLVILTFPHVRSGASDGVKADMAPVPFMDTIRLFGTIRALPNMTIAATLQAIISSAMITWIPAFLTRSHHMAPAAIGASLGAALGLGSLIGHIAGGPLLDWLGKRDLRWHFWVPMITAPITGLLAAAAFLGPLSIVFVSLGLMLLLSGLFAGPIFAIAMSLSPAAARATVAAWIVMVMNGVALGLGPQVLGIASDLLRPAFGEESLRYALLGAAFASIPAAFFYYRASRTYLSDISTTDAINRSAALNAGAAAL